MHAVVVADLLDLDPLKNGVTFLCLDVHKTGKPEGPYQVHFLDDRVGRVLGGLGQTLATPSDK